MPPVDTDTYELVKRRVEECDLTAEERQVIATARQKINSSTSVGGLLGGGAAYWLAKSKRWTPLRSIAMLGGGFFLGSQVGFAAGILAAVRAIEQLPNSQRIKDLVVSLQ
ncbi:hypothetical protein BDF14DRAFT_1827296 [Spinellus fusiger]|nr:hypothetical protein BDF14DRAFT_1827296 [Spinellus fusiger]